jgi:hypothetical protein
MEFRVTVLDAPFPLSTMRFVRRNGFMSQGRRLGLAQGYTLSILVGFQMVIFSVNFTQSAYNVINVTVL